MLVLQIQMADFVCAKEFWLETLFIYFLQQSRTFILFNNHII